MVVLHKPKEIEVNRAHTVLIVATVGILIGTHAIAVPMQKWFEQQKEQCTDHLNVRIVRVEQAKVDENIEIEVEAEVLKVSRTKSTVSVGDLIVIQYHRPSKRSGPLLGGGVPAVPVIEEEYGMFITKSDRIRGFKPAAGYQSFENLNADKSKTNTKF